MSLLLNLVLYLPLIGALSLLLLPRQRPELVRWLALIVSLVTFVISLLKGVFYISISLGSSQILRLDAA